MNKDSVSDLLLAEKSNISGVANPMDGANPCSIRQIRSPSGFKIELSAVNASVVRVTRNDVKRCLLIYTSDDPNPHEVYIPQGHSMMDTEIHSGGDDLQNGRVLIHVPKHPSYGILSHSEVDIPLPAPGPLASVCM